MLCMSDAKLLSTLVTEKSCYRDDFWGELELAICFIVQFFLDCT
jgi:hypothetical protein